MSRLSEPWPGNHYHLDDIDEDYGKGECPSPDCTGCFCETCMSKMTMEELAMLDRRVCPFCEQDLPDDY